MVGIGAGDERAAPLTGARLDGMALRLPATRDRIHAAPVVTDDGLLTDADLGRLERHYGAR